MLGHALHFCNKVDQKPCVLGSHAENNVFSDSVDGFADISMASGEGKLHWVMFIIQTWQITATAYNGEN